MRAILKSLGRALVLGAATASVIGLAAAPALAATTWTVKPGGAVTGTAGTTTVTDTTASPPLTVTCTSSVFKGTLKKGSGLAGKSIGTFSSLAFNSCTADNVTLSVTLTAKMPLNAVKYNSTKKTASMTVSGLKGTLSVTGICSATIAGTTATTGGTVHATWANKTSTLTVLTTGSTLHLYNDSCPITATGDAINFTGAFKFAPKTTITSP